jgi:hypothetical protein
MKLFEPFLPGQDPDGDPIIAAREQGLVCRDRRFPEQQVALFEGAEAIQADHD